MPTPQHAPPAAQPGTFGAALDAELDALRALLPQPTPAPRLPASRVTVLRRGWFQGGPR